MRVLVVIPTYNEADNISRLVPAVLAETPPGTEVLVVDDASPDGTGELIRQLAEKDRRIHLLERDRKLGLGSAYVEGFKYALRGDYDFVVEMDADFSHEPREIKLLLERAQGGCDLVIGSRYVDGITVIRWPLKRLVLSIGASKYVRAVTGLKIHDCTSGFKCFRRRVLEAIDLDAIHSDGYSFQIEMSFKAHRKGFKLCEVPITFVERRSGISKMSRKIVYEAVWMVWKLRFYDLIGKL
ncbi:MAG: polyprenol monophosphomannose synthase [candidate division KSB1 bacterium]|nr:polyprenol monophosphomannose synthase [candidate division KSB1 bacterium]MDZ7338470.1 polyprenol monophosphomannose synthase [candidate division KSB1 bacterium]MDZ7385354.1 polyprenol monophosphomannose synthase [candidate division KSB1 bacterium]MDZ7413371.1 polyprenol monophosphomannose synthase [candidate division KSB1 bacterium]